MDQSFYPSKAEENYFYALDSKGKWQWTEFLTFGEENKFLEPKIYSKKLEMTELMLNPEGIDKNNEWVELFNNDSKEIDLKGWFLFNQAGKEFELTDLNEIDSQKRLLAEIKNTSFSLRNSEGWVELRDPSGEVVDKVSYIQSIKENVSLNKNSAGQWLESIFSTPGEENRFNNPPTYKVDLPDEIYEDVKAEFEIENAKDKDDEELKYRWDFGDGKRSYLKETTHIFNQKGKYIIQVKVGDASSEIFKNYEILVKRFPQLKLRIVKLVPNPEGSDSKNEKIWIENLEKKNVNLKGWVVATGSGMKKLVNHYIKDDFKIKAGEVKVLEKEDCPFSLLNKKGRVVLKAPNGKEVDKIKYDKEELEEGEIYYLENGEWLWQMPFSEEKELETFVLGETSSNQEGDFSETDFLSINKVFNNSKSNKTDRLKAIFFENWLFFQSQKTFFKFIFPQSYWGKV